MSQTLAENTAEAGPPVAPSRHHRGRAVLAVLRNKKALVGVILFLVFCAAAAYPHMFVPWLQGDPQALGTPGLHPSAAHWLGTTNLGQDIYAELVYGTRQTLLIALIAGVGATVLSVVIGVSAAYLGGFTDSGLSLLTDVFLVLPAFPLIIVFAAYSHGSGSTVVIVVVLIATGWAYGSRQMRAQGLSLRNREFLEAARVRGERRSYIIFREILPTMTSLIIANFLGAAVFAVLTAAGIQFLGLGNTSSLGWGIILYHAQQDSALLSGYPAWTLVPGLAVALLGASFALMNYAFDEIGNPALRPVRRHRGKRAGS